MVLCELLFYVIFCFVFVLFLFCGCTFYKLELETKMPRIVWLSPKAIISKCRLNCRKMKVIFYSFCYNSHCDFHYVVDTLMEPMFWFVDNYVNYLGPLFVGFLVSMMGLVILVAYFVIVPYEWVRKDTWQIVVYFVLGHYLLINTLFHYYMAYATKPGFPPEGHLIKHVVSICRHCISPKPPRTHHCSICGRCVLKMDHHCPWLNQCVGHYNHRYFLCTMFFMWIGCLYIVIGMWQCFKEHYLNKNPIAPWCLSMNETLFYAPMICSIPPYSFPSTLLWDFEATPTSFNETLPKIKPSAVGIGAYNCVVFEFFTAAAMVVGVGALLCWHVRLISRGETSIEQHINKQTNDKFSKIGKVYINPYDFGWKENWLIFLGHNDNRRSFWRHVLFPSAHKPVGDGLSWKTVYNKPKMVGIDSSLHIV